MATSDRELEPGALVLGKLRVVRTLGVGGMGAVYEVEHALTRHHRALKILHRRVSQSSAVVARFHREASAAARIGNQHIAETFDAGTLETGEAYLLMELLEGETLDARLKRKGPFDPRDLAELIRQACDGVSAAHQAGIVHRDLKPENLFVTTREHRPFVKVLDFGISKFERDATGAMGITAEGAVMGTPFYMPPEQVRGLPSIDHRADVYSLGVILYECASGVRPYEAQTIEQLAILIHEGKALPLNERRPELPAAFCGVVMRAMNVDRDARFPSAKALSDALAPTARARISILPAGVGDGDQARVVLGSLGEGLTELGGTMPAILPPTARAPAVSAPPAATASSAQATAATLAAGPSTATASPVSDTMPPPDAPKKSRLGTPVAVLVVGGMIAAAVLIRAAPSGVPGQPARTETAIVPAVPSRVAPSRAESPPTIEAPSLPAPSIEAPSIRAPTTNTAVTISVNDASPELSVAPPPSAAPPKAPTGPARGGRPGPSAVSVATRANAPAPSPSGSAPPTRASQSGLMEAYPH